MSLSMAQKYLVDETKLRVLRWGEYSEISRWALKSIIWILTSGKQREI
jgi:hypothetical protein